MGNSISSTPANPRFISAARAFTQNELEELRSLFTLLASQSHTNGDFISPSVFKRYFRIPSPLGERLFDLVTQERHDQMLRFEDLVIAKAAYEKGLNDDAEEFIYRLLDVTGDGTLGRSDMEAALSSVLEDLFPHGRSSDKCTMDTLLNAAQFSKVEVGSDEKSMSLGDLKSWCTLLPSVRKYLGRLLIPHNQGPSFLQIPHLIYPEKSTTSVLLKEEYAWLIGGALPQKELEGWKLLYNSSINGLSFNTFLGSISSDGGPTLVIVKDREGYIYGGYASQPWERHSNFYGDMKSFLFQLYPKASIFRRNGANNNVQWCAVKYSSEDIPNGIGFGGRVNHFGLYIAASLDHGHTFSCSTFGSPCLSKSNQILPDVLECWGFVQKGTKQESSSAARGTVLDRFKEERNMLNMVGIANSSV